MKLKKCNAVLALASVFFGLVHIGYSAFAYLTFYYNPTLKMLTAIPFLAAVCLHAVLGMLLVFLQGDGTRLSLYPKLNKGTVVQRVTAALIFPLLIVHLNTFSLLQESAAAGNWFGFALVLIAQVLFYIMVDAHIVTSFTKALITLGALSSEKKRKTADRIVWIVGAALFLFALFAILKTELAMFVPGGAA